MAYLPDEEQYTNIRKIGHGSFGVIKKVTRKTDNQVLCRKEIAYRRMSHKEREQLHAEFTILSTLRHPNIVAYYHREHFKKEEELHLYMEYCGGGDLSKIIQSLAKNNQYAEESYVWSIFAQLVTALYRCHYGVDPPEVGKNVMQPGKQMGLRPKNAVMILHRDLKPENVFLGEDDSVKLGDFGLSKQMLSNDFASTYVGTPYYMSPEICAAERYTLHSDIWSLGCIMYELCTRRPPFEARSHFELAQKIKAGVYPALPSMYSTELANTISSCLKTNPLKRPDTAALLELPVIRLLRKEREVVEIGKQLKQREEYMTQKLNQAEAQITQMKAEHDTMRQEIDASLRREWEVKARLAIDRETELEKARLQAIFEKEIDVRVQEKLAAHIAAQEQEQQKQQQEQSKRDRDREIASRQSFTGSDSGSVSDSQRSSRDTNPSSISIEDTDLSSLSLSSPKDRLSQPARRMRTPFARSRTHGAMPSPADIHMVSPSPAPVMSNLNLSPRSAAALQQHKANLFGAGAKPAPQWQPHQLIEEHSDEESDSLPALNASSPTRGRRAMLARDFPVRPGMRRQTTAPVHVAGVSGQTSPTPSSRIGQALSPRTRMSGEYIGIGSQQEDLSMHKRVVQRNAGRTLVELSAMQREADKENLNLKWASGTPSKIGMVPDEAMDESPMMMKRRVHVV